MISRFGNKSKISCTLWKFDFSHFHKCLLVEYMFYTTYLTLFGYALRQ